MDGCSGHVRKTKGFNVIRTEGSGSYATAQKSHGQATPPPTAAGKVGGEGGGALPPRLAEPIPRGKQPQYSSTGLTPAPPLPQAATVPCPPTMPQKETIPKPIGHNALPQHFRIKPTTPGATTAPARITTYWPERQKVYISNTSLFCVLRRRPPKRVYIATAMSAS